MHPSIIIVAVVFIAACCAVDARTRRIPNVLSGSAALIGLVLNAACFGLGGVGASLGGMLVTGAVLMPAFALGGIGAGDVKMMGALGALLGPELALAGLALGMIFGGVVMLVHLARRDSMADKLGRTWAMVTAAALSRSVEPLRVSAGEPGAITLPYSVPLGLGTVAVILVTVMRGGL